MEENGKERIQCISHPGLQTPLPQSEQLHAAMSKALGSEDHSSHDHSAHGQAAAIPGVVLPSAGGLRALEELVIAMNPQARQVLSDSIALYASSIASDDRTPRALHGSAEAPVWVTDFTDPLCSHCASLHHLISQKITGVAERQYGKPATAGAALQGEHTDEPDDRQDKTDQNLIAGIVDAVVILSDELWRSNFGAREDVLGETVLMDGESVEIVGVMPPGLSFPQALGRRCFILLMMVRSPRCATTIGNLCFPNNGHMGSMCGRNRW